jgi:hypothetical protein
MMMFKNNPSEHRGKVYKLTGRLIRLEEKLVDKERAVSKKIPHFPLIFVGQITESSSKKPYTFRVLDIPDNLVVGDYVTITGIYVKRFTYESRKGPTWFVKTPLIMGKRIRKFKRVFHIWKVVGVVGAAVFIMMVGAAIYERKKYGEFQDRMAKMKERRRGKAESQFAKHKGSDTPNVQAPTGQADKEEEQPDGENASEDGGEEESKDESPDEEDPILDSDEEAEGEDRSN